MDSGVRKKRGDFGERVVGEYLTERGFEVISRNYRRRSGEIDIIAVLGGDIAFVEVKTRKFGSLADGITAVTKQKQRRIVKAAELFLQDNPQFCDREIRFDAAVVVVTSDGIPELIELKYYKNSFDSRLL